MSVFLTFLGASWLSLGIGLTIHAQLGSEKLLAAILCGAATLILALGLKGLFTERGGK